MNLVALEKNLGIKFKNKKLLEEALIHRSYLNEAKEKHLLSNERLEFLGDTVLSLIISNHLYQKFPQAPEGELTSFRAALVKTQTLAKISQKLELGDYLLLSRGEEEGGGRRNLSLLADTFEALIGAIFLDQGLGVATNVVAQCFFPLLPEIIQKRAYEDFKSLLQEKIQGLIKVSPTNKVLKMEGPDHNRTFTIGCFSGGKMLGTGRGRSKQEAEEQAARIALEKIGYLK